MRVQIESYRPLVIQEAWKVWQRLPRHTRIWLGMDDLVEMGMAFAWKTAEGLYGKHRQWSPEGGASFGTYLKNYLFRFYDGHVEEPYVYAYARRESNVVSMEELMEQQERYGYKGTALEAKLLEGRPPQLPECMLVDSMVKLYEASSPYLQECIAIWFLYPERHKLRTSGQRFLQASSEFRWWAGRYRVTMEDCRHFMRSPVCLDQLARKALWIPYSLDDPTPGLRRP